MENLVQTKLLKKQETEVSFSREIKSLYLGEGDTFYGEGILAGDQGAVAGRRGLRGRLPGSTH